MCERNAHVLGDATRACRIGIPGHALQYERESPGACGFGLPCMPSLYMEGPGGVGGEVISEFGNVEVPFVVSHSRKEVIIMDEVIRQSGIVEVLLLSPIPGSLHSVQITVRECGSTLCWLPFPEGDIKWKSFACPGM